MPPAWLQSISAIYVPLSIASAILVIADIFLLGRRQKLHVMQAAWPLTILYWGPIGCSIFGSVAAGLRAGAVNTLKRRCGRPPSTARHIAEPVVRLGTLSAPGSSSRDRRHAVWVGVAHAW